MAHVSVVKKLERCERIGQARQADAALLHADHYQVIKYKIKIKDYFTTNPPAFKLLQLTQQSEYSCKAPSSCNVHLHNLHSLQNHADDQSRCLHDVIPCLPLNLPQRTAQGNDDELLRASFPWKLPESSYDREEDINWAPRSSPTLQQPFITAPSSPCKPQKSTGEEKEQLGNGEDGRGRARSPWKLQNEVQEKAGGEEWEGSVLRKMECECCGMEEECTGGYEEKVRERLKGHWLCGLCEEAVGEERKRVGGSMQAALAAHMQPCRRFSRRARSKDSPPMTEVGVPHAVCRLLCRHLSTPAPRHRASSPSSSLALSRSSSCLPSLSTN